MPLVFRALEANRSCPCSLQLAMWRGGPRRRVVEDEVFVGNECQTALFRFLKVALVGQACVWQQPKQARSAVSFSRPVRRSGGRHSR